MSDLRTLTLGPFFMESVPGLSLLSLLFLFSPGDLPPLPPPSSSSLGKEKGGRERVPNFLQPP